MGEHALILYNPTAGQASAVLPQLEAAAELWREAGWRVDLRPTQCAGDATVQAKQAATEGYSLVVAAGGDGTVNEVVNGLVGTEAALAALPCGTVNIWAREMGLPMDILQAAQAYLEADRRTVDLGVCRERQAKLSKRKRRAIKRKRAQAIANGSVTGKLSPAQVIAEPRPTSERHFLLMASAGFDAAVTSEVKSEEKKRFGAIAYVKQAFQTACRYRGVKTKLYVDGKRVRGRVLMVVIGNSQLYGGVIKFTAHALIDDGLLDVCVIKGRNLLIAPQRLLSVFTRVYNRKNEVRYYRAKQIEIRGKKKKKRLPVQADGDYLSKTPMKFEVLPRAMVALVPQGCDETLWTPPGDSAASGQQSGDVEFTHSSVSGF